MKVFKESVPQEPGLQKLVQVGIIMPIIIRAMMNWLKSLCLKNLYWKSLSVKNLY